jgi:ABC-2 type transport system permease protein
MIGFGVWLRKEMLEITRTWRRVVLPVLVLFLAVMSPVLAYITPELLRSAASDDPDVVISLPDPTAIDAIQQWAQSLGQIIMFAIIIVAAGSVSNDLRDGTGQLALVKPLGRAAFILAKFVTQVLFLALVVTVGAGVCGVATALVFGEAPTANLVGVTLAWFVFAAMFVALMTLLSTVLGSQAAAVGAGLAIYVLFSIAGIWKPAQEFSPAGLLSGLDELAAGTRPDLAIPVLASLAIGAIALYVAVARFERMPIRQATL